MCVDFIDLNKVCPKDCFPLPRIDQLVDATTGHQLLSFMDAYSGYNQIRVYLLPRRLRALLLQSDALQFKKSKRYIYKIGEPNVHAIDREDYEGVCRRHVIEKPSCRGPPRPLV